MWGTKQTNILLVPSFLCWEREREREGERGRGRERRERESGGGGRRVTGVRVGLGWGWGAKGERDRGREPVRGWRQGQGDRPTDQQGWNHEFHPSEEVITIITKSSYHHHTSIHTSIFHIADYHWSIDDRLTINQLSKNFRSCIDCSFIDRYVIDRFQIVIHWLLIHLMTVSIIDGSIVVGVYGSIVRSLAIDHDCVGHDDEDDMRTIWWCWW